MIQLQLACLALPWKHLNHTKSGAFFASGASDALAHALIDNEDELDELAKVSACDGRLTLVDPDGRSKEDEEADASDKAIARVSSSSSRMVRVASAKRAECSKR